MTTNRERAALAEACLDLFADNAGWNHPDEAICDLIANLGHYAQRQLLDFPRLVARAISHWHLEQSDEDSVNVLPTVTILIGDGLQTNESKVQ